MKSILILATALAAAPFAAGAQTVSTTTKATTTSSKPTMGKSTNTVSTTKNTTAVKGDGAGNMAVHKTTSGKTITYDCSKAGNKNKAACKK